MITLIIGGSGSGKSAYAESYVLEWAKNLPKYYIATMQVYDAEGEKKVERHRRLRAGKGFVTIEQSTDIAASVDKIKAYVAETKSREDNEMQVITDRHASARYGVALLECMSNLVANEMFSTDVMPETDEVVQRIVQGIKTLAQQLNHLVIVSNNVFEDGIDYDESTLRYIEALGRINTELARIVDHVTEVVVGIPITVK